MAINMNQLTKFLVPDVESDAITNLIRNYLVLKYRMDHLDEQNFYFKSAKDSNLEKLIKFEKEYNERRQTINACSEKGLLQRLAEAEKEYRASVRKNITPLFARAMLIRSCEAKIETLKTYLLAKSKFKSLLPIDEYEENEELLKIIFEA